MLKRSISIDRERKIMESKLNGEAWLAFGPRKGLVLER